MLSFISSHSFYSLTQYELSRVGTRISYILNMVNWGKADSFLITKLCQKYKKLEIHCMIHSFVLIQEILFSIKYFIHNYWFIIKFWIILWQKTLEKSQNHLVISSYIHHMGFICPMHINFTNKFHLLNTILPIKQHCNFQTQ